MKNAYFIFKLWVIIIKWLKESPYLFESCNSFTKKSHPENQSWCGHHSHFIFTGLNHSCIGRHLFQLIPLDSMAARVTEWERETGSLKQFLEPDLSFAIHSLTTNTHHAVRYFRHQQELFNKLWNAISVTVVTQILQNRENLLCGSWI